MRERLKLEVTASMAGCRLDRFLRLALPDIPAKSVRFSLEAGDVDVGGDTGKKGRLLKEGDVVTLRRIAETDDWMPVPGDLSGAFVLYEDEAVAVLEKPVNVHTEPQRPLEGGTLAGYLRWRYPAVASISNAPGLTLLTRLDYATSGAIPAALSGGAYEFLVREREQGRIEKTYLCLVEGRLDTERVLDFFLDTEGGQSVRTRMDRSETDRRYWTKVSPVRFEGGKTLVRAVISKGKRHQVRAHLASAGFPIVGDRRYGTVPPEGPGRSRLLLHASEVRFQHPTKKTLLRVTSPLPAEFGFT